MPITNNVESYIAICVYYVYSFLVIVAKVCSIMQILLLHTLIYPYCPEMINTDLLSRQKEL